MSTFVNKGTPCLLACWRKTPKPEAALTRRRRQELDVGISQAQLYCTALGSSSRQSFEKGVRIRKERNLSRNDIDYYTERTLFIVEARDRLFAGKARPKTTEGSGIRI